MASNDKCSKEKTSKVLKLKTHTLFIIAVYKTKNPVVLFPINQLTKN